MCAVSVNVLLATVLILWLLVASISCFGVYRAQRDRPLPLVPHKQVAIIMPMRGVPAHFDQMWHGICAQSYNSFRIIFAVESAADPAYAALPRLESGPPIEITVAGPTTKRAQKIHNVLAALRSLKDGDRYVVFADADIVPDRDWLRRLMKWADGECDVASGYRWMVPSDHRWATAFACVINSSLATAARVPFLAVAWGGSMAMGRTAIEALELEQVWDRSVSDDLTLTRRVWARGGRVRSARDVLVPSLVSYTWKDAIAFGRRQYLLMRIHMPWHWALFAATTTLPVAGWAVALPLAMRGSVGAIAVIVAANVLDQIRAYFRRRLPRKLWNTPMSGRVAFLDQWGTPIWLMVNAITIWSTLFGHRITWAGRSYTVNHRGQVLQIEAQECGR